MVSQRENGVAELFFRGGQEGGELVGGGGGELGEGVLEPGPGVHAELLAGSGEARQDRQASSAVVAAEEEPVLAADGVGFHGEFGDVVVDRECTVGDIDVQPGGTG